jgi:hypothetical protein
MFYYIEVYLLDHYTQRYPVFFETQRCIALYLASDTSNEMSPSVSRVE